MEIKHSILVITYNHENFIKEAIDSLIFQTELPYEIIIVDDKSSDNTFQIILEFSKKYPNIIRAYQNTSNLGVYKNYERVKELSSGNIISFSLVNTYLSKFISKGFKNTIFPPLGGVFK